MPDCFKFIHNYNFVEKLIQECQKDGEKNAFDAFVKKIKWY